MTDMKKVMQALQNCPDCSQCYTGGPGFGVACRDQLRRDALALLKEQEQMYYALEHDWRMCIKLLKDQDSEWISVNDRLPELNQDVLVYAVGKIDGFIGEHVVEKCKRFTQHMLPSSPGREIWSSPYQYFHTDYEITHWMPLPEPPKEGR